MLQKLVMATAIVVLAGLGLAACIQPVPASEAGGDAAQGEEIMLYVGPELVDCVGSGPQKCMLVKENPDDEYTLFYDQIQGFEYEPGYEYELQVLVAQVDNPPADASSLKYTLIEVVNKTPVEGAAGSEEMGNAELTLEGVNWQAVSYVNAEGQSQTPAAGAEPTALFEDGSVNGTTGCNNYFGSYQVSGDQLTINDNTGMTMMACPDPLMTQEQAYLAALGSVATYTIVDGQLQLSNADGQVVLTYIPLEPVTLTGTTWEAIGYNNGKQAVVSIIIDSQITALFGEDGILSGSAGCNNYNAGYEVEEPNIKIDPAVTTRMMCAEPEGVMEQESLYLAALQMAEVYTIDGDRLQLRTAEGSLVADYRAQTQDDAGEPVSEEMKTALANMEYKSEYTKNGVAPLENGEYSEEAAPGSATKTVVKLTDNITTGEIDGQPAAAVMLVTDPGGSGTFFDLALVMEQDGKLVNMTTTNLGDRVQINSIAIEDNQIAVNMVIAGPDDPMCCPSQHVVRTYAYQDGKLAQTNEEVLGVVASSGSGN